MAVGELAKGSKGKGSARRGGQRMRYDPETKSKILAAARGVKPISKAFERAKGVGYRGTPESLYQMLYIAKSAKNPKRDRPIRRAVAKSAEVSGLGEIEAIVKREVAARIKAARDAGIAAFNKALGL